MNMRIPFCMNNKIDTDFNESCVSDELLYHNLPANHPPLQMVGRVGYLVVKI